MKVIGRENEQEKLKEALDKNKNRLNKWILHIDIPFIILQNIIASFLQKKNF